MFALIVLFLVALAAGALGGLVGTGSSLVLLPILRTMYGPRIALPIMGIAAVMANVGRVAAWWRQICWRPVLAYALPGTPAAVIFAKPLHAGRPTTQQNKILWIVRQSRDGKPLEVTATLPGAPGGNGNALNLAALDDAPQAGGMTFTQSYASLASQVGQSLNSATEDRQTQQDLLDQARTTRSNAESVSLDEEATQMIEYQRAYQATARVVTILNDLTETVMNMLETGTA